MKKLQTVVVFLLTMVSGFMGVAMVATGAPWFGVIMIAIAVIALVATFWPKKANHKEGEMIGKINYEVRDNELTLNMDLEDLVADAGLPEDVIRSMNRCTNENSGSKDYYFCEMIPQDNDHKFLKRLVLIRVDSFGNLRSLNVMLNGVSYENSPNPDSYRNFDIYLGGEFMMRLAAGYFPILAEAFNEDIELYWPRVDCVDEDMIQNEQ